ncbi:amidohydrolase family protein [Clostridium sp. SHJSY1]|uniref:amidohydrolase family protein n=1 Tax=Clostridium sp. SHJSY1 TaxID=2942483 RepID=UPI002873F998|nr:amidohydrolase family protein [Clostridium sp. SHJSY1]MDS0527098.1 amidohydrolase family protein [Clostridium sp. SHJSY1]
MIIDGHAHVTEAGYGNIDTLLAQYKEAKIDKGVLVPGGMLDVRQITKYISGEKQPETMEVPNHLVLDAIKKYPDKFYGFYCVNPHMGKTTLHQLEEAVKQGFVGLKLAPMVHQFSFSSNIIYELAELCGELGIPFYAHVVYSPAASTNKFNNLVKMFPKTKFILGHMGFGPADTAAIQYAMESDNLYLETSQGSYLILKQALEKLGSKKIIFGTEFPMYHPIASLSNVYALGCSDSQLEDICCNNILELIEGR